MNAKFDAYEYAGVIAPGAIAIFAAALIYPDIRQLTIGTEATIGGLGMFVLMSYVFGHLLQGAGNVIEWLIWLPFGGMPTQWVLKQSQSLIAPVQRDKLLGKVKKRHEDFDPGAVSATREWISITREMYVIVRQADQTARIDAFNRTYGLMRGMIAGLLLAALLCLAVTPSQDSIALLLVFGAAIAAIRMFHFGVLYARELLVTFSLL